MCTYTKPLLQYLLPKPACFSCSTQQGLATCALCRELTPPLQSRQKIQVCAEDLARNWPRGTAGRAGPRFGCKDSGCWLQQSFEAFFSKFKPSSQEEFGFSCCTSLTGTAAWQRANLEKESLGKRMPTEQQLFWFRAPSPRRRIRRGRHQSTSQIAFSLQLLIKKGLWWILPRERRAWSWGDLVQLTPSSVTAVAEASGHAEKL